MFKTWVGQLQVVVDEAFTNIVSHGEASESVFISLTLEGKWAVIEIWDQGHPFDPEEAPLPDLGRGQEHGMGVVILKELADEVSYFPKGGPQGWNRLRLLVERVDGSAS